MPERHSRLTGAGRLTRERKDARLTWEGSLGHREARSSGSRADRPARAQAREACSVDGDALDEADERTGEKEGPVYE
jgi:hypothetical protein